MASVKVYKHIDFSELARELDEAYENPDGRDFWSHFADDYCQDMNNGSAMPWYIPKNSAEAEDYGYEMYSASFVLCEYCVMNKYAEPGETIYLDMCW